jgi:hypothetical protein
MKNESQLPCLPLENSITVEGPDEEGCRRRGNWYDGP